MGDVGVDGVAAALLVEAVVVVAPALTLPFVRSHNPNEVRPPFEE